MMLKRGIWRLVDAVVDYKICPTINAFRAQLGLTQPAQRIFSSWWNSPQLVLGMWPQWFAPSQPDWPAQTKLAGFPLFDETGITPIGDELDRWLDAGAAPVAFTAGSAMAMGERFFGESAQACARLNRRGILLTRHTEQLPRALPAMVRHFDYAPFGQLLPRCAALVHHGGIGTTSQALRAGVPQLIMPMAHDQFDNAARVERLGVGRKIGRRSYRASKVARRLHELIDSPDVRSRARQVASRFEGASALQRAADLVESLAVGSAVGNAQVVGSPKNRGH
jgi:UDP:flavonoid glycosyltransferase YjiC (YdhE family)